MVQHNTKADKIRITLREIQRLPPEMKAEIRGAIRVIQMLRSGEEARDDTKPA